MQEVATRDDAPAAATAISCPDMLPPLPTVPANALRITDFGAIPNDDKDDRRAIEAALRALKPGGFLVVPPGRFLHDRGIDVTVPNATLIGEPGAVLHATNPEHQALSLKADGASLYRLTLTAVTRARLSTGEAARIAIFSPNAGKQPLRGNVVRGNVLAVADSRDPVLSNSASSAGILVFGASDFLIADNSITRSLSDGIHVTEGSRRGLVVRNRVRQTGDDMIAVVSYCDLSANNIATPAALARMLEENLVTDVIVAHNDVADQFWGRGLSVVGGERITIEHNKVRRTPYAAGILVAREDGFKTCGAHDILVRNNVVNEVQTAKPSYEPAAYQANRTLTGHAAIEIHALVTPAERSDARIAKVIDVGPVSVTGNTVGDVRYDGLRAGDPESASYVHDLSIADNGFMQVGAEPLSVSRGVTHSATGNMAEQARLSDRGETVLKASGSSRSCRQALESR